MSIDVLDLAAFAHPDDDTASGIVRLFIAALLSLAIGLAVAAGLHAVRPAPTPKSAPAPAMAKPVFDMALPPLPPLPDPAAINPEVTPDDARLSNAAVPLAFPVVTPAPVFRYAGSTADRAAATACLAAAVLYEAGDDPVGERAVAQVVINRMRHPAFPKSICGVVFQGSERTTGCQFTFTCDGALARRPPSAAWQRAEEIATKALNGAVAKAVGTATHYHADYVVPYWRNSLAKLATVGPHIFYRWPGTWGEAGVLTGRVQPGEPLPREIAVLAGLTPLLPGAPLDGVLMSDELAGGVMNEAPGAAAGPRTSLAIEGVPKAALKGSIVRLIDAGAGQYVLQLDPGAFAGGWAITGYTICVGRPDCLVMGWTSEGATPRALPVLPAAMRTLAFMYRKSGLTGTAQPFWDCGRFPRADKAQCLPGTHTP